VSGHRDTKRRAVETRSGFEGEPNFRRGSPEINVPGVRHTEKHPEAARTARGARWKPMQRYPVSTTNL